VDVEDDGVGIPPEVVERIFDPFFTTKPVGEGSGLGLGIAYEIVRRHGGEISVSSEPGQGSRFRVQLPTDVDTLDPTP
jgi:two-component system NtrC family sensor kinase